MTPEQREQMRTLSSHKGNSFSDAATACLAELDAAKVEIAHKDKAIAAWELAAHRLDAEITRLRTRLEKHRAQWATLRDLLDLKSNESALQNVRNLLADIDTLAEQTMTAWKATEYRRIYHGHMLDIFEERPGVWDWSVDYEDGHGVKRTAKAAMRAAEKYVDDIRKGRGK